MELKRKLINQLLEWKETNKKAPILLTGAKGVGKTYLALDFAKTFYDNYIYINYELNTNSMELPHSKSITSKTIEEYLCQLHSKGSTLLIFDEVYFFPEFIRIIEEIQKNKTGKESKENTIDDILVISSRKLKLEEQIFNQFTLYPLDFEEFLLALNQDWYIGVIKEHFRTNLKIPDIVHSELLNLYNTYLRVGGMPMAVTEYVCTGSESNISQIHKMILNSYLYDIDFDFQESIGGKVGQVIRTLPIQLNKENKKFQYSFIRKGATRNLYLDAIEYLKDTYYGMECTILDREDSLQFKLYLLDTGILNSMGKELGIKESRYLQKGLVENYVAIHLNSKAYLLNFWESESQAKIDFVIKKENSLLPVEVKIDSNTRSKSINMFRNRYYETKDAIRISKKNFSYDKQVKYVPLYAVFCL